MVGRYEGDGPGAGFPGAVESFASGKFYRTAVLQSAWCVTAA